MRKNQKNEPVYSRWMEIFVLLMAGMMVFLGWKEHKFTELAEEKIRAEQEMMEQNINAEQIRSGQNNDTPGLEAPQENIPAQPSPAESGESRIRVLLMNNDQTSGRHEKVILQSPTGLLISGTEQQEWQADTPLDLEQMITVGETVCVTAKANEETPVAATAVLSMKRSQGTPSYEGTLEIHRENDGFYIVNEVDLETYLKYVVPSEMPSSYPEEALKAQAVCARTYAVKQMQENRLETCDADVDDTVSYQVYNNIPRQESTDLAVEETKGEIMRWGGEPIQAYFFSTSCGFTSSDEVWAGETSAAYLRSVPLSQEAVETLANGSSLHTAMSEEEFKSRISSKNPLDYEYDEPWYRWEISIPWDEMTQRAASEFPQIGSLQGFEVGERSAGGAVKRLLITGSEGQEILENEYKIREFLSPGDEPVLLQNGTSNTSMRLLPSAYIYLETVSSDGIVSALHIQGGGYGHGVGMSQNGAKHLAQDGMDWRQILSVFYKDITIAAN